MSIRLTFLGTGTSSGVPMIGCGCEVCTSDDPRDRRDRPGAMVRYEDPSGTTRTVLIDTTPDLRHQMLRHDVRRIDGVVYTHNHADHVFGIDDLRRFNAVMKDSIEVHAEQRMIAWLAETFRYIFDADHNFNKSFVPRLVPMPIAPDEPFAVGGRPWRGVRLLHGRLPILGFRIGDLAYCTDCSAIPPETWPHLDGLDTLVIDALRYKHHPTHMTVDQALEVIDQVRPRRAYLTHIAHEILHADLEPRLPEHVSIAYDGLEIESAFDWDAPGS